MGIKLAIGTLGATVALIVASSVMPGPASVAAHAPERGEIPQASYTMTAQALGVNTASYDGFFKDEAVAGLLRQAGIGRVRLGGSGADFFDWESKREPLTWPEFMGVLAKAEAAPVITVDYGLLKVGGVPGPKAAANWVRNALTLRGYSDSSALWIISNEEYGPWEPNQHQNPHVPQAFATNALPYIEAIHAADPNAKVGVPVTISRAIASGTGTWVADPDLWNRTVLGEDAKQINVIDFHWYPIFGAPVLTNAQIFETVRRIPGAMKYLQRLADTYDPGIPISVSESNISQSEIVYNAQPLAALYAAASALTFLSHGASDYLWWQVHNWDNMNGDFGFLSNETGEPGPSASTLSAPAAVHARNISVTSAAGFYYGHQFTIGSGGETESRKITAVPGSTRLSAASASGSSRIYVATTGPYAVKGSDTNRRQLFAPGTPVRIGTSADAEMDTVASVGSGAATDTLVAPSAPGSSTIYLTGVDARGQKTPIFVPPGIVPGARLTIGSGATEETATVKRVGEAASFGTTLVMPAKPGATRIHVASVADTSTGVANYVGDPIVIDSGAKQEVDIIAGVGTSAGSATTLVVPAAAGARKIRVADSGGVSGRFFWPGDRVIIGTSGERKVDTIRGVGATAPPIRLAVATARGATTILVSSVEGIVAGDKIAIGPEFGPQREVDTVGSVGTAGVTGTGITLASALRLAHATGARVQDPGAEIELAEGLGRAQPAGASAEDLGTGITLARPLTKPHAIGAAATDAGTGIVLTAPLRYAHVSGQRVSTPGTGITLTMPLRASHASGEAVTTRGITFTPALSHACASGTPIHELGLKEPPLDTPMPAFWGFVLASKLTMAGSRLSELASPKGTVLAFRSFLPGNSESVMLINTDDATPVTISLGGMPGGSRTRLRTYSYGLEEPVLNPSVVSGSTTVGAAQAGLALDPESILVLSGPATGNTPPGLSLSAHAPVVVTRAPGIGKDGALGITVKVSPEISGVPACTVGRSKRLALSPGKNGTIWRATIRGKGNQLVTCRAKDDYGNGYKASLRIHWARRFHENRAGRPTTR